MRTRVVLLLVLALILICKDACDGGLQGAEEVRLSRASAAAFNTVPFAAPECVTGLLLFRQRQSGTMGSAVCFRREIQRCASGGGA